MCGITGILANNAVGRMNLIHLEAATRALSKRGPDHQGSWFDDHAGLGHRRLSIIDTSEKGNQPIVSADSRYRIIFNGEIYNYRELAKELSSKGYTFSSSSDTEVLLYAYIHWGEQCLQKLNGFFAFAIYDQKDKSLFVARDRMGIKPLYYYHDEDKFLFASELKSILSFGIKKEIDRTALHLYFQLTYIPSPYSIFKNIFKLDPGHFIKLDPKDGFRKEQWYDLPKLDLPKIKDLAQAKALIKDSLQKSVNRRLVSDVPLGAFLSGGIDSSVIVALASAEVEKLNTFSVGFSDNKFFDETKYAALVAKKYNTNHHVFSLSTQDLFDEVQNAVDYLDEPFGDSSSLPVFILSKKTKNHVKVALSGDGADELFSGYNKHEAWLKSINHSFTTNAITKLSPIWSVLPKSRNTKITDIFRRLDKFSKLSSLHPSQRYWYLASFTHDQAIGRLLKSEYGCDSLPLDQFKARFTTEEDLNEFLRNDMKLVLEGDMLVKVDRMSMANGLEVRVPFLDHELVQNAFQLDAHLKANASGRKLILKNTFEELLPTALLNRPKHGFEVPLLDWFRKDLAAELNELVFNEKTISEQAIFNWEEIKRIKKKLHSLDPGDVHVQVWTLYVFQKWYRQFYAI
ncbi:MAG: asparagine synthase (glutamine-hydrolyzing) [Cyclobacteriaceae bacterium]